MLRLITICSASVLASLLFTPNMSAQKAYDYKKSELEDLQKATDKFVSDTTFTVGDVGILVQDVLTGKTLCSHNAQKSLIPASNQKIIISSMALKVLGAQYRFNTEFQTDGIIKDSVLFGNFFIKGAGDPTLGSPHFDTVPRFRIVLDSVVVLLRKAGIHTIRGKIIADASVFTDETAPGTWLWEDLGNYYGASPSGINFNDNEFQLLFSQKPLTGTKADIAAIVPTIPDFFLRNTVTSAGKTDETHIFSAPFAYAGLVSGTIPTGQNIYSVYGAVPDPPYLLAWHLRKTCIEQGIKVTDSATTLERLTPEQFKNVKPDKIRKTLFSWQSPALEKIVQHLNFESVNLYAEILLRVMGKSEFGIATAAKGVAAVEKFWRERGLDTRGLFYLDASGLSPRDGVTPEQLGFILRYVAQDSVWFNSFYNSLPEAGRDGTLKSFLNKTKNLKFRVHAKSGTISRVKSYSGYLKSKTDRLWTFSVIANNFTCSQADVRKKIEQFLISIGGD